MSTPEVTVMVSTFRPGGLDITLAGMRDQTFQDFEVVIVDHRYEKRHGDVLALAATYGILDKVIHVPEHRRNGKWNTICSAWNTALAVARGKYVIFLQDYAYAGPGWIEEHLSCHLPDSARFVVCPYTYTGMPKLAPLKISGFDFANQQAKGDECLEQDAVIRGEVFDEMYIFEGGAFQSACVPSLEVSPALYGTDIRRSIRPEPNVAIEDGWVHLKNESVLRERMLAINGLDERLERGKGPADTDIAHRIRAAGVQLAWYPNRAHTFAPNARMLCKTMPYGNAKVSVEGRWSFEGDGMRYNRLREVEIAGAVDKAQAIRAKNLVSLEILSQMLEPWRRPGFLCTPRDVDDSTYWGRDIWPESP